MIRLTWTVPLALLAGLAGCADPSTVSVSPSAKLAERMRVAVLDFDWTPPSGKHHPDQAVISAPNAGKFVADSVSARLVEVPGFEVMERSNIARLLDEKKLSQADLVRQGKFREIGKFLDADLLVLGTVNTYTTWAWGIATGHMVSFSCRCVSVDTSEIVWTLGGNLEKGPNAPLDPAGSLKEILDSALPKLKRQLQAVRKKP